MCKSLQFDINVDIPELAYPLPFIQNPQRFGWQFRPGYVAITAVNAFYDFINYFVFVCIHLVADLVLIKKLTKVLMEKEVKMRQMKFSEIEIEKVCKENQEAKRGACLMVVLNSIFNMLTKVPSIMTSLNDLRVLIFKPFEPPKQYDYILYSFNYFELSYSFRFFCYAYNSCLALQNTGNCLYLVSLSSVLFFLKSFDKNFKNAYKKVFHRESKRDVKNFVSHLISDSFPK